MKLSTDSPELTAYALDELSAAERVAIEAALIEDPRLRAEVEGIRSTAAKLQADLGAELAPALASVQRAWIEGRIEGGREIVPPVRPGRPTRRWRWWSVATAMSGVLLLALFWSRRPREDLTLARLSTPDSRETLPTGVQDRVEDSLALNPSTSGLEREATTSEPAKSGPAPRVLVANETAPEIGLTQAPARLTPSAPSSQSEQSSPSLARTSDRALDAAADSVRASVPSSARGLDPADRDRLGAAGAMPSQVAAGGTTPAREPFLAKRYGLVTAPASPQGTSPSAVAPLPAGGTPPASERAGRNRTGESRPRSLASKETAREPGAARLDSDSYRRNLPAFPRARQPDARSENPFRDVAQSPLSTFGLDVDTASYANTRRYLRDGSLPPVNVVRIEELVNYFTYDLPAAKGSDPFGVMVEVADCPWYSAHRLVRVALRAREVVRSERSPANLVFLVDVSGSMQPEDRLPLVKRSLRLLVDQLTPADVVSLVTYAGEAGIALEPTPGSEKQRILQAIDQLGAGGSTHGSAGIQAAYELARKTYFKAGINRVLLCTDGDFNVGTTSREGLISLIADQAKSGVFLSVLGFGTDNFQDGTAELLADRGNGNYSYIDSFAEARKVLREQLHATLITVAKDAKVQLEFNPSKVESWRLLGYENRILADRDFKDDRKDAGEVGAGQTVTMLYEIVPPAPHPTSVDPLRYRTRSAAPLGARLGEERDVQPGRSEFRDELLFLKLRSKRPDGTQSSEWTTAVKDNDRAWNRASADFQFCAAVAGWGLLLQQSEYRGELNYALVLQLAQDGLGRDAEGYRSEFIDLVRRSQKLDAPR